jgi:hypothetical protein
MSSTSKVNKPFPVAAAESQESTEPPTQPGAYWFQREPTSRMLLLEVRMDGKWTVWWPNEDQPIANLKGRWRGPIPPSSGPGSR